MSYMTKKLFNFNLGAYSLTLRKKGEAIEILTDEQSINPQLEYESFFKRVNQWLLERDEKTEKLELIDFLLTVVKKDIQIDLLSEVYYRSEGAITNLTRACFIPLMYMDESGANQALEPVGRKHVDLAEVVTIVVPWKRGRMRAAIINVAKRGFNYDKDKHFPTLYFAELDLCYAMSGNHHIASGIIQKSGHVVAEEYNIATLFDHVTTDGGHWLNAHTKGRLTSSDTYVKVFDFRIAVLYELARMKYQLSN